jgi:hypothetical protein
MGHIAYYLERPVLAREVAESLIAVFKEFDCQPKFGCAIRDAKLSS